MTRLSGEALAKNLRPASYIRPEPTPETLAYLAGVLDSDGHIGIYLPGPKKQYPNGRTTPAPKVEARQVESAAVLLFYDLFGGSLCLEYSRGSKRRAMLIWQAKTSDARRVLRALYPYARIKRRQYEIVFELEQLKEQNPPKLIETEVRASTQRGRWGNTITRPARVEKRNMYDRETYGKMLRLFEEIKRHHY